MKVLHVSAGGRGQRMADHIAEVGYTVPKHLLPIPAPGDTLLGEIIRRARESFDPVRVWTGNDSHPAIALRLEDEAGVEVILDQYMTGPLGPMLRDLLEKQHRVYGCAGDFYNDFSWDRFEQFHDAHARPITILVARSVSVFDGALFHLSGSRVQAWERVRRTSCEDRVNMGGYIVDPTAEVLRLVSQLGRHKEDEFFDTFVSRQLVAAYDPGTLGFNVNTPGVYLDLVAALRRMLGAEELLK